MTVSAFDVDLDLDAARREGSPLTLRLAGNTYTLPAELPASVLDPLLDGRLDDLLGLIGPVLDDSGDDVDVMGVLATALRANPVLPRILLGAIVEVIENLFAPAEWEKFQASRPSLPDYLRLVKGLWARYGVGLGEALGWSPTSARGGATSKPTSPPRATTRARSGTPRAVKG